MMILVRPRHSLKPWRVSKKAYNPSESQEPAKRFGSLGQAFLLVRQDV
jgi:hypothetical protein